MGVRAQRKRAALAARQQQKSTEVEESPFKPGTRLLRKGWKWVKGNSEPVRVK